jgi:GR25 family glycosyltransferase involved in LPS biosynthesis
VACAMSHMKLWKQLLSSDKQHIAILEDDVTFSPHFESHWKELRNITQKLHESGADLIWFGYKVTPHLENSPMYEDSLKPLSVVPMKINNYWSGAFSYIITRQGAAFLLNVIQTFGLRYPIDTMMMYAMMGYFGQFSAYGTIPRLVSSPMFDPQDPSCVVDSNIQNNFEKLPCNLKIMLSEDLLLLDVPASLKKIQNCWNERDADLIIDTPENAADLSDPSLIYDVKAKQLLSNTTKQQQLAIKTLEINSEVTSDAILDFINKFYIAYWAHCFPQMD